MARPSKMYLTGIKRTPPPRRTRENDWVTGTLAPVQVKKMVPLR